jgi:hypothetical protein
LRTRVLTAIIDGCSAPDPETDLERCLPRIRRVNALLTIIQLFSYDQTIIEYPIASACGRRENHFERTIGVTAEIPSLLFFCSYSVLNLPPFVL